MSIVITEDRGAVRHVVMNRPEKRNAMNDELIAGLGGRCTRRRTTEVLCVVIRGGDDVLLGTWISTRWGRSPSS
jgi:enoyl-CoA hydratase/carnithine racemase